MTFTPWEVSRGALAPPAQVGFVLGGVDHRLDCADVRDVEFEAVDRVRVPTSWKHKRNYTGYYWAATTGRHVWFESLYERVALMQFDRDPRVVAIAAQPMRIDWTGSSRWHAPDFFIRFRDGSAVLVDVKPASQIRDRDVEAFDWTSALCDELGWGYVVVRDISESEGRNLRFLSGYRYERWHVPAGVEALRSHAGESAQVSVWASVLEDVADEPLGAVYAALWWRDLIFDASHRLSLKTIAKAA